MERWSPTVILSLSPMCSAGWVCVINREAHSLFIFFQSLNVHFNMSDALKNYLLEAICLGDYNNSSAPQLSWTLPPWSTRRVNLNSIVGTIALTYKRGLTSMNLHDFIILMTLPIGTSGYNEIQMILPIGTSGYNISEYIQKLQIHQV